MPGLDVFNEIPTQFLVFLAGLSMVCGYAADWALDRWGFGIFVNVAVFLGGACLGLMAADRAGYFFWEDGLSVILTGIAGGAILFIVLATVKNKLLP